MAYQDVAPTFASAIAEQDFQGNRNQRRERVRERIPKPYVALTPQRIQRVFNQFRNGKTWQEVAHEINLPPETLQNLAIEFAAADAYFDALEEAVIVGGG